MKRMRTMILEGKLEELLDRDWETSFFLYLPWTDLKFFP